MSQSAKFRYPVGDFDGEIRNSDTVKIENQDLKSEIRVTAESPKIHYPTNIRMY